jgi:hypothetical protein
MELKEFEKFVKICCKYGITEIDFQGIRARFNEKQQSRESNEPEIDPDNSEPLTPEQLMFYSAG